MYFLSDEEIEKYKMLHAQIAPDPWHITQVHQFEPGFAVTCKSHLYRHHREFIFESDSLSISGLDISSGGDIDPENTFYISTQGSYSVHR